MQENLSRSKRTSPSVWTKRIAGSLATSLALTLGVFAYEANQSSTAVQAPSKQQAATASPAALSRTFVSVANDVKPAVVHINVTEKIERTSFPQIPGFDFGFGNGPQGSQKRRGSGSGVIVSKDGYIVTNNHVVGKATEVEVKLADGRKFKARKIGTDPLTDLAVVKIEADNLPVAVFGDSDQLQQGDWVLAIGSPFGLEQTITAGIVSAIGRDVGRDTPYASFIQTDASINPGNSGGPLVNMDSQVVGINTMIYSESGGNQGIGFAVPSSMVKKVYEQLVANGRVSRGWLGVSVQELTPELLKAWNLPDGTVGVLVGDLADADGPAAKGGIKSGDIIQSIDGRKITTPRELTQTIGETPANKLVAIGLIRDGKNQIVKVTLAEREDDLTRARAGNRGDEEGEERGGKLGVGVETVTPELARDLDLKIKSGVVIRQVVPGSPASEAGLQRGDVIHRVNRQPVQTVEDLNTIVRALQSGDTVVMQVERRGQLSFVTLTIE